MSNTSRFAEYTFDNVIDQPETGMTSAVSNNIFILSVTLSALALTPNFIININNDESLMKKEHVNPIYLSARNQQDLTESFTFSDEKPGSYNYKKVIDMTDTKLNKDTFNQFEKRVIENQEALRTDVGNLATEVSNLSDKQITKADLDSKVKDIKVWILTVAISTLIAIFLGILGFIVTNPEKIITFLNLFVE